VPQRYDIAFLVRQKINKIKKEKIKKIIEIETQSPKKHKAKF